MDRLSDHRPVCRAIPTTYPPSGGRQRGENIWAMLKDPQGSPQIQVLRRRSRPSKLERLPRERVLLVGVRFWCVVVL